MEVAIIGASLSGFTLALACASRGIRAHVLERGQSQHQVGSALGVDRSLLIRVAGADSHAGREDPPFPVITGYRNAVSWLALHGWLRDLVLRRTEITLLEGVSVREVVQCQTHATAITATGRRIDALVIVGADGYRSVVRSAIDPGRPHAQYAGYLLWRGLVPEFDLPRDTAWPQGNDGVALATTSGFRLIAYPVPNEQGSLHPGERLISFAWYDAKRDALLREFGCLSNTNQVLASLGRASVPDVVRDELRDLARQIWPEPWRTIIVHAVEQQHVFATPVAEYFPHRLCLGRLAIIGDAAHVAAPKEGRGFTAGIIDADVLADCLGNEPSRSATAATPALKLYEDRRLQSAQQLVLASMKWSREFARRQNEK